MKALTISQPYASLIISGKKSIENRRWETHYRGPLAIHAGGGLQYLTTEEIKGYLTGCILGEAQLVACLFLPSLRKIDPRQLVRGQNNDCGLTAGQILADPHCEGPWLWILKDVVEIEPFKINGHQGLWDWDETKHSAYS